MNNAGQHWGISVKWLMKRIGLNARSLFTKHSKMLKEEILHKLTKHHQIFMTQESARENEIIITDHQGNQWGIDIESFIAAVRISAFVDFYDGAQVEHDSIMKPLDWAVSTLLQAPIRRYSPFEELSANNNKLWNDCNKTLAELGQDIPLLDPAAEMLRSRVTACFTAFMRPKGIGPSIAAKTLHKKRPELIPVIDDYVATVLSPFRGAELKPHQMTDVLFNNIRPQLIKNKQALFYAIEKIATNNGKRLTASRIFDIAVWMLADEKLDHFNLLKTRKNWEQPNRITIRQIETVVIKKNTLLVS